MADKVLPKAMEDVSWAKPPIQHSSPQPPCHLSTPLGLGFPFPEPIFTPPNTATTHIHPTLCRCHAAYE